MKCGHSYAHWLQMKNFFLRLAVFGMICSWVLPDSQLGVRKRATAERYCGPKLADKMHEVCKGYYNAYDYTYAKRTAGSIRDPNSQGTKVNTGKNFCRC
jgi:hypothetical protein